MFKKIIPFLIVLFACEKDFSPVVQHFSGIAVTDEYNLLIKDDPDDWQPRCTPGISGIYCMLPAFPNPTDSVITFLLYLNQSAKVSVKIYDKPNHQIVEIMEKDYPIGFNKILWNIMDKNGNYFNNGIYWVKLIFKINSKKYESDGDILIKRII